MQDFRELRVWEKAHALTLDIYRVTQAFPKDEIYGLTSQIRRAAVSVGANIAEGCGKDNRPDFARFLQNAAGSASEVEYHLLLAPDLGYMPGDVCERLGGCASEIKRMLTGLIQTLRKRSAA